MRRLGTAALVIVLLGAAAVFGMRNLRPTTEAPARDVVRASRVDLTSAVKATGIIKPMVGAEVRVGSRVSGVVRRLHARIGDSVRAGQLLAELDDRELVARANEARAALDLAEANLAYARADLKRKQDLAAEQLVAPSDLDLATRAHAVAEQQRGQAAASLEFATTQLGYAQVSAPISGVVSSVTTQEGETVAASFATPMFVTLVDLTRLEVWAYVDETDIGRIRVGQPATFAVDTYPGQEFDGRVTAVHPQAEIRDNVVNYVAVVRFTPPRDRVLRPEMTATVRVVLDRRERVLALPLRAVRHENGRAFVWCARGEAVERRFVTLGQRTETHYEIVDGLRDGDEVVAGEVPAKGETAS